MSPKYDRAGSQCKSICAKRRRALCPHTCQTCVNSRQKTEARLGKKFQYLWKIEFWRMNIFIFAMTLAWHKLWKILRTGMLRCKMSDNATLKKQHCLQKWQIPCPGMFSNLSIPNLPPFLPRSFKKTKNICFWTFENIFVTANKKIMICKAFVVYLGRKQFFTWIIHRLRVDLESRRGNSLTRWKILL